MYYTLEFEGSPFSKFIFKVSRSIIVVSALELKSRVLLYDTMIGPLTLSHDHTPIIAG
jgi:hypothetical protein